MLNFEFKNPTKIIFGKETISTLSKEIPANAKVLMLYGTGSIKKNGIYEQVKSALTNFETIEFGGIPANPEYEVLVKALEIIKTENIIPDYNVRVFALNQFCPFQQHVALATFAHLYF